ncbi:MAG: hypothetical protein RLZZ53_1150, partial [Acidobacteriota bacterium]
PRVDRRKWLAATVAIGVGLLAAQAALFALHALEPASGETMVRRFFLWQVLNLFEAPGERQFMIPLVVLAVGVVLAPRRVWPMTVVALSVFTLILSMSIAQASNSAPLSWPLVQSVLVEGSRYPLDMFWHLMRLTPITLLTGIAFLVYRSRGEWPAKQRAAHLIWIGWVLWFGVIESGITTNYMLLPLSFVLIAIAIDAATILPRAAVIALALVIGVEQWRATTLAEARPTIVVEGIEEIKSGLGPNDRVVCTDELGCLMLVGRIDRWLALDEYVRERFLVRRGDGPVTGVYTGVPAVFRPADLFAPNPDGTLPDRIVVVDVFKDYPIGNSRSWLPKAIEEDGVKVTPLLETPQARVLEVSAPEALAIARLPRDQVARFK